MVLVFTGEYSLIGKTMMLHIMNLGSSPNISTTYLLFICLSIIYVLIFFANYINLLHYIVHYTYYNKDYIIFNLLVISYKNIFTFIYYKNTFIMALISIIIYTRLCSLHIKRY